MTNGDQISITLSPAQVDQVVRAAGSGRTPGFATLISNALSVSEETAEAVPHARDSAAANTAANGTATAVVEEGYFPQLEDRRLSRSLLRGLSVLTCFNGGGESRGIIDLAGQLDMSPSTTHRYVTTLVELGLLERCPKTRKYRLASA